MPETIRNLPGAEVESYCCKQQWSCEVVEEARDEQALSCRGASVRDVAEYEPPQLYWDS